MSVLYRTQSGFNDDPMLSMARIGSMRYRLPGLHLAEAARRSRCMAEAAEADAYFLKIRRPQDTEIMSDASPD